VPHQLAQHQQVDPGRRPNGPGGSGTPFASRPRSAGRERSGHSAPQSTGRSRNPPAAPHADSRRAQRRMPRPPIRPAHGHPCRPPRPAAVPCRRRRAATSGPQRPAVHPAPSAARSRVPEGQQVGEELADLLRSQGLGQSTVLPHQSPSGRPSRVQVTERASCLARSPLERRAAGTGVLGAQPAITLCSNRPGTAAIRENRDAIRSCTSSRPAQPATSATPT